MEDEFTTEAQGAPRDAEDAWFTHPAKFPPKKNSCVRKMVARWCKPVKTTTRDATVYQVAETKEWLFPTSRVG